MIRFFTEEDAKGNVILWTEDNGWGIDSADLPRIFEKSFTGKNGRRLSSTGMGLYLSKKLCDRLGLDIRISSKEKEYTEVTIFFPVGTLHPNS